VKKPEVATQSASTEHAGEWEVQAVEGRCRLTDLGLKSCPIYGTRVSIGRTKPTDFWLDLTNPIGRPARVAKAVVFRV